MTTATTFSGQNDADARASTTKYRQNLFLVVLLVSVLKLSIIYFFVGYCYVLILRGHQVILKPGYNKNVIDLFTDTAAILN